MSSMSYIEKIAAGGGLDPIQIKSVNSFEVLRVSNSFKMHT